MSQDPYVYPGTNVLRNARDIRDAGELQIIEANLTLIATLSSIAPPITSATSMHCIPSATAMGVRSEPSSPSWRALLVTGSTGS